MSLTNIGCADMTGGQFIDELERTAFTDIVIDVRRSPSTDPRSDFRPDQLRQRIEGRGKKYFVASSLAPRRIPFNPHDPDHIEEYLEYLRTDETASRQLKTIRKWYASDHVALLGFFRESANCHRHIITLAAVGIDYQPDTQEATPA